MRLRNCLFLTLAVLLVAPLVEAPPAMADSPALGVTVTESVVGEHTMTIPSGANVLRLTLIGAPGGTIPTINGFPATGGLATWWRVRR